MVVIITPSYIVLSPALIGFLPMFSGYHDNMTNNVTEVPEKPSVSRLEELDRIMLEQEEERSREAIEYAEKKRKYFDDEEYKELLLKIPVSDDKNERLDTAINFAKSKLVQYSTTETSLFIRTYMKMHFLLSVRECDTIIKLIDRERQKTGLPVKAPISDNDDLEYDMDSESGRARIINDTANAYIKNHKVICLSDKLLEYDSGIYEVSDDAEAFAKKEILELLESNNILPMPRLIKGSLDIVKTKSVISIKDCEPNARNIIVLGNGTLDIRTFEFTPFNEDSHKDVYFTKIPVHYDPNAKKPELFLSIVDKCFAGDERSKLICQEMFGYCLTRNYKHQLVFYLIGDGGNGKGTMTAILEALLGIYNTSHSSLFQLTDHHNSDYYIAKLLGKFANICGDEGKRQIMNTENLKKLTSNTDTITGRNVREKPIDFVNFAKIILLLNQMPKMDSATFGEKRRYQVIEFNNRISNSKEEIKDIHRLVIDGGELPGVLLWALEGLKRVEQNGCFSDERTVAQKFIDIEKRSNPMEYFLEDCIREDVSAITPTELIYDRYNTFRKSIKGPELDKKQIKEEVLKACWNVGWKHVDFRRVDVGLSNRDRIPEPFRSQKRVNAIRGIRLTKEAQTDIQDFESENIEVIE